MDVNNDADEIAANVMETFDWLMDSKKKIQCAAITNPVKTVFHIPPFFIRREALVKTINTAKTIVAIPILNQTNKSDSMVISFPRMAVNPKITTIKCSSNMFLYWIILAFIE